MNNNNLLERKIYNLVKSALVEASSPQSDEELKATIEKELETAHSALNRLMVALYFPSQQSQFANEIFEFTKQADDNILLARQRL